MKVLVTGGTGFIGSALVRHLLEANYEVRILSRHKRNRFLLEDLNVEVFDGDITHPNCVEKAMKGCPIVFDLASVYAFYPFWDKKAKALYRINVQGTINMLNAALKNKVQRFIHTSTIATISKRLDGKPSDENTGFNFRGAIHYARAKYLAEQEVLKFCKKGLPAIILNPAIIIGERDYKPTPSGEVIVKFLNRSYPGYFDTTWAVADVDDVARAHIAAIDYGRVGERYILCNKKHYTLKEIFRLLEKISGVKSPRIRIPYPLLLAFVYIEEFLSYTIFKRRPIMSTEGVSFCRASTIYDNSKAVDELNYISTPIEETLTKAVSWYRKNGYIEPRGILRFKTHGSKKVKFIMQYLKMHKYTDKLNGETLSFYFIFKLLQFLKKVGIKPRDDGWRQVTKSYLRTEHSKFTLAVFRLDFNSDLKVNYDKTIISAEKHIIQRLTQFIRGYREFYYKIAWNKFFAEGKKTEHIDMVHAKFSEDGYLENIEPYFDANGDNKFIINMEEKLRALLIKGIIKIYNNTINLPDKKRPRALKRKLYKWCLEQPMLANKGITSQAENFIDRVLSATFIRFERLSQSAHDINDRRYQVPSFIKAKHPGFGLLNILCRFSYDLNEADLWIQYSHIPVDGVPMQEILNNLKQQWGKCGILELPLSNYEKKAVPELCSTKNSKKGIYYVNQFINFQPFIELRKSLNKRYAKQMKSNITIAALFIWKLSQYRVFENVKFAIPVDLRATKHQKRTLGFVFIRPSIYFDKYKTDKGFLKFQQEFNRQLRATVRRRSEGYNLLESYSLVSPFMYAATLKVMPSALREFVGTVGVTIIKKAEIFIAPFSDVHIDGFIAISNFLIPAKDKTRRCNVSIKGSRSKIVSYLEAIKEVANSLEGN